jgi:hypothetical protein
MDIICTGSITIQIYSGCVLADSNYIAISDESKLQRDDSATSFSDGILVYSCISTGTRYITEINVSLTETLPLTIVVKGDSADLCFRFVENY